MKRVLLLAVAYYISGKTGVYHLDPEGQIDTICAEVSHTGHSIDSKRQVSPHPHWVGFRQKNKFLYVPDLGTDQIWIYQLDHQTPPQLTLLQKALAPQGTGPRHMAFHPMLNLVYVGHELQPRISRYTCDPHTGKLTYLDRTDALPKAVTCQNIPYRIFVFIRLVIICICSIVVWQKFPYLLSIKRRGSDLCCNRTRTQYNIPPSNFRPNRTLGAGRWRV
ncbi:beta-propeller fold lactonase family protein [Vibrio sp. PP-XX7]